MDLIEDLATNKFLHMMAIDKENKENEINNEKKALNFVSKKLYVEEKIDGTKLVIVRTDVDDKDKWYNNWIVAYKGNILYPDEFNYLSDKEKQDINLEDTTKYTKEITYLYFSLSSWALSVFLDN